MNLKWTKLKEGGWFAQSKLHTYTITPVENSDNLYSVQIENGYETVTRFTGYDQNKLKKDCELFAEEINNALQDI